MTRASRPLASMTRSSPCSSLRAHEHADRPLDVDVDHRQAEAALLADLLVAAGPLDLGVDERDDRAVGLDAVDEQPVRDADLRRREADAERVVHEHPHAPHLVAQRAVEALDRRAFVRRTGSPSWRTCASAARRRSRTSGSSGGGASGSSSRAPRAGSSSVTAMRASLDARAQPARRGATAGRRRRCRRRRGACGRPRPACDGGAAPRAPRRPGRRP